MTAPKPQAPPDVDDSTVVVSNPGLYQRMTALGLPESGTVPNPLGADSGAGPLQPPPPSLSSSEPIPAPVIDSKPSSGAPGQAGAPASSSDGNGAAAPAKGTGPGVGPEGEHRQVGRYRIKNRVGRGGMAAVFRAEDPSIGRDVAIKFLHAALCEDEESRVRFLREARAAGGLSHPNIVVVHDVGEVDRRPYMAMELIDGAPLSDLLNERATMPVRDVVLVGLQLARALEYAYGRGVVHRDIKPSNIMLLRDGKTVKVADFGIASMEDGSGEQRTIAGTVMGTPQYMSPEQTRGEKLDGRSDLFSVGIVLYQMLAGERPFRGNSMIEVANKIASQDPPSLAKKRTEVPASLRRVVERCLAKDPGQRYQTGGELAAALVKALRDIDEAAADRDKARMVPLRYKWAATMALIVALVMGLTSAIVTHRQYAAMMGQVSEYGASLARFIAAQNAAAVLGEEWEAVDVSVQAMMNTRNFERLLIIDRSGVVRVSSRPELIGQPYQAASKELVVTDRVGGETAVRYQSAGESVLGFEAPVLFQGKEAGRVALGIPEQPVTRVARLSIVLMGVLALVTVLAVAVAMYFLANWFAKPIRLVGESMGEIAKLRFDHRIQEHRNDEFGQLYRAFDEMAQALQAHRQREPAPATLPTQSQAGHGAAKDQTPSS
jgi:HAMP domain-containing protein